MKKMSVIEKTQRIRKINDKRRKKSKYKLASDRGQSFLNQDFSCHSFDQFSDLRNFPFKMHAAKSNTKPKGRKLFVTKWDKQAQRIKVNIGEFLSGPFRSSHRYSAWRHRSIGRVPPFLRATKSFPIISLSTTLLLPGPCVILSGI